MKVLVYPHDLGIGGSQLNAIELAYRVHQLGHDVIIYGQPGPLTKRISQLGLEFIKSPDPRRRPSPKLVRDLAQLIESRSIDIAHGYEWPPGLECYFACRGSRTAQAVTTVMSMAVASFLPHSMLLSVGTEQIAELERSRGRHHISVIEPPVDTTTNHPGSSINRAAFISQWGLDDGLPAIVCVSRLAHQLKLEGLLTAIDAIETLHRDVPARLVIVGDGLARSEIEAQAHRVNTKLGYLAIVLTGELADPRAAYDVADVCLAMGGSALRSMSFAKPLIVAGEGGFFRLLTPESLPDFLWTGWYGQGGLTSNPIEELRVLLLGLLRNPARRLELGAFGQAVVEDRFSLASAAVRQLEVYESALEAGPNAARRWPEEIASAVRFSRHHLKKRANRLRGVRAADDFNAKPVARNNASNADREHWQRTVAPSDRPRGPKRNT